MAGSRENPCPDLGHVVTIKLSEGEEGVMQSDGAILLMHVETHYQMNYHTGDGKQIKKCKRLDAVHPSLNPNLAQSHQQVV
jgi:negative elongation factor A